jgi:hypothetical protein
MAILGRWTGGVQAQGNLPETWTAPSGLFPTEARNDSSTYSFASSTSTLTLPSSGLSTGYLLIGRYEYADTSNGRFNPQGRIVQTSGGGNFVAPPSGGINRDTANNISYVSCWAFIDSPTAASTYQFQWKADTDDATGGTDSSSFDVIPLVYADIGMYASTSAALYGGTTPNVVTIDSTVVEGTNITRTSNTITVTGNNKRYFVISGQFYEGRGGRTQRWFGHSYDSTPNKAAQAYSYYRNAANDENGSHVFDLIQTTSPDRTIEITCYSGDGVLAGEGGAESDGSTPSSGDHALVVLELNDSAEVFRSKDAQGLQALNAGIGVAVDLSVTQPFGGDIDFVDISSFSPSFGGTYFTIAKAMDALAGGNVSAASSNPANTVRYTGRANLVLNSVEDLDVQHGNYFRGDQSTTGTFGYSANPSGFISLATSDQLGLSNTQVGNAGQVTTQAGWVGFWGINLDTLGTPSSVVEIDGSTDGIATTTGVLIGIGGIEASTDGLATTQGILVGVGGVDLIEGSSDGISTNTGALIGRGELQASTTGVASTTGILSATVNLSGQTDGLASTSATLAGEGELQGSTDGITGASGTLIGISRLQGIANGASTTQGILVGDGDLEGASNGIATAQGILSGGFSIQGSTDGAATTSGVLIAIGELIGNIDGVASTSGIIIAKGDLQGSTNGTATTTGIITSIGELQGSASGAATTTGSISSTGVMQGLINGNAATAGLLLGSGDLIGSAGGVASTTGVLTGRGSMQAAILGQATTTGVLNGGLGIEGTAGGVASVSGTLTAKAVLVGSTAGTCSTLGILEGIGIIAGTSNGASATSGTITNAATSDISGQTNGVATIVGTLIGGGALTGDIDGIADVSGTLSQLQTGPRKRRNKKPSDRGRVGGGLMVLESREVEVEIVRNRRIIEEEDEELLILINAFLNGVN